MDNYEKRQMQRERRRESTGLEVRETCEMVVFDARVSVTCTPCF